MAAKRVIGSQSVWAPQAGTPQRHRSATETARNPHIDPRWGPNTASAADGAPNQPQLPSLPSLIAKDDPPVRPTEAEVVTEGPPPAPGRRRARRWGTIAAVALLFIVAGWMYAEPRITAWQRDLPLRPASTPTSFSPAPAPQASVDWTATARGSRASWQRSARSDGLTNVATLGVFLGPVSGVAGAVAIAAAPTQIRAFDAARGTESWRFDPPGNGFVGAASHIQPDTTVIAAVYGAERGRADRVALLDLATGATRWERALARESRNLTVSVSGELVVVSGDGGIEAFGRADGAARWRTLIADGCITEAVHTDGFPVLASTYCDTGSDGTHPLDPATGTMLEPWTLPNGTQLADLSTLIVGGVPLIVAEPPLGTDPTTILRLTEAGQLSRVATVRGDRLLFAPGQHDTVYVAAIRSGSDGSNAAEETEILRADLTRDQVYWRTIVDSHATWVPNPDDAAIILTATPDREAMIASRLDARSGAGSSWLSIGQDPSQFTTAVAGIAGNHMITIGRDGQTGWSSTAITGYRLPT